MTFEELEKVGFVAHHNCGACEMPVGYYVHPIMVAAVFNSGCACSNGVNERVLTWKELENIPIQKKEETVVNLKEK